MLKQVKEVTVDNLVSETAARLPQGYRLITITCTDLGDAHDLLYHFDKNLEASHLRLRLPKGDELPSISVIYFAAAVVENEIKELFGIPITGLAIDYEGRFLLTKDAPQAPQNKRTTI
jgi:ech hydrogenase subunit D